MDDIDFDIESSIMTTLIDNGLLENVEDPISLMELNQPPVIDLDNIDATIEDPGYILEEPPDVYSLIEEENDEEKKSFSSFKKPSFTLPATFFDISRNIKLLKKCRPISIKIVDCDIYPWYYKEIKNFVNNNNIITNNEQLSNQQMLHDSVDFIDLSYTCVKKELCPPSEPNFSKINLSSEQTSLVLQLKQEVQACVKEVKKNMIDIVDEEINKLKNCEDATKMITKSSQLSEIDKSVSDFGKGIKINDLLTCKAIAQTIVRKIEHAEVKNKISDKNISIPSAHNKGKSVLCNKVVNNVMLMNAERAEKEKNANSKNQKDAIYIPKTITSPILPCNTKTQKKTKPKQNASRAPKKSIKVNNILEKCHISNRNCDKFLSSSNRLIPHYHFRTPSHTINSNNNYFPSLTANQIYSPEFISRDSGFHWQQPIDTRKIPAGNTDSIPPYDYQGRQEAFSTSLNEVSKLGYYYDPHFPNLLSYENHNIQKASNFPRQVNVNNKNNLHLNRCTNVAKGSKEKCYASQSYTPNKHVYDYYVQNNVSTGNEYAPYNSTQISFTGALSNMANSIQTNPVLTQMLNSNNLNGYYQSTLEQGGSESIIGSNAQPLLSHNHGPLLKSNPPSYEEHVLSTSFEQNNNYQYPYTQMYWDTFSNIVENNLSNNITNSHLTNNTIDIKNSLSFPIDASKVTNVMPSKTGYVVGTGQSYTEGQTVNRILSASCEARDQKALNHLDTNVNTQTAARNLIQLPRFEEIKVSKQHIIDPITDKSVDNKINKIDGAINGKFSVNSILNPSEKNARASNMCTISQPTKDTSSINTFEQVPSKANGYSSPILPIPSFKKILEIISDVPKCHLLNTKQNNDFQTHTYGNKQYEQTNLIRKRKLDDEEKKNMNNKRISLQEYQLRRIGNERTLTYVDINTREKKMLVENE